MDQLPLMHIPGHDRRKETRTRHPSGHARLAKAAQVELADTALHPPMAAFGGPELVQFAS
jgi:hypothetical protein